MSMSMLMGTKSIGFWILLSTWTLLLSSLVLVSGVGRGAAPTQVTVGTDAGPVTGYQFPTYRVWKGIPYAAPPVGPLRWQPTQRAKAWGPNALQAFDYAPACPQHCSLPPGFCPTSQSEDCLHLNVWTPPNPDPRNPWPVLVFFAGGAFFQGDGGTTIYAGAEFVAFTNVTLVTCSYRLGALGFLVLGNDIQGNFGIEDQRQVLRWVKNNIGNFGGNPNSVTIFGESAGAQSIGVHLTSTASAGLFDRAIMESNPFALEFKHLDAANDDGVQLAGYLNCDPSNMSCLLSKTADEIVDAQGKVFVFPDVFHFDLDILLQWTPTIDGRQLFMQPIDAFIAGKFNKVPIILGSNANEGIMFVWQAFKNPEGYAAYATAVTIGFREDALEVLEEYPESIFTSDSRLVISRVVTDYLFGCATRRVAEAISGWGVPTYLYNFDHALSFPAAYGPHYQYCADYACHGTELPFLFHTADQFGFNYTKGEEAMSEDMMHYWSNFARSNNGDPNFGGNVNVTWVPFTGKNLDSVLLATPVRGVRGYNRALCNFWDSMGYNW